MKAEPNRKRGNTHFTNVHYGAKFDRQAGKQQYDKDFRSNCQQGANQCDRHYEGRARVQSAKDEQRDQQDQKSHGG